MDKTVSLEELEAFILMMEYSGFTSSMSSPYISADVFYSDWISMMEQLIKDKYDNKDVLLHVCETVRKYHKNVVSNPTCQFPSVIGFGVPFLFCMSDDVLSSRNVSINNIADFVLVLQEIVQEMKGKQTS